jgi:hypothetical protein
MAVVGAEGLLFAGAEQAGGHQQRHPPRPAAQARWAGHRCMVPPLIQVGASPHRPAGADVPGSLFEPQCKGWTLRRLRSLLSQTLEAHGVKMPGVNEPYLYVGSWRSMFAWCGAQRTRGGIRGAAHSTRGRAAVLGSGWGPPATALHALQAPALLVVAAPPPPPPLRLLLSLPLTHTLSPPPPPPPPTTTRHTEDMDLHSVNYLHCGASKQWCAPACTACWPTSPSARSCCCRSLSASGPRWPWSCPAAFLKRRAPAPPNPLPPRCFPPVVGMWFLPPTARALSASCAACCRTYSAPAQSSCATRCAGWGWGGAWMCLCGAGGGGVGGTLQLAPP